jgi:hypothetical protein
MSRYYMNELAFELPDLGFRDVTVTELATQLAEGRSSTLVVHREPMREGASLHQLVADNLREAGIHQRGHEVIFQRESEIASRPAIEHAARWRGAQGMVYTRQAHLVHEGHWLVFGASAWFEDRAKCDAYLDHVLATLRLRD